MPTRKISDLEGQTFELKPLCRDPEHNPPSMMVFEPGHYEHECPSCHEKMNFTVMARFSL